MITGSVHALTPSLSKSLLDYRAQVITQRHQQKQTAPAEETAPASRVEAPKPPAGPSVLDQVAEGSAERRDRARQTALDIGAIRHTQNLINTYVNATSDDESGSQTSGVDPVEAYRASLRYSRRLDLVNAFEQTGRGDPRGQEVNFVV